MDSSILMHASSQCFIDGVIKVYFSCIFFLAHCEYLLQLIVEVCLREYKW